MSLVQYSDSESEEENELQQQEQINSQDEDESYDIKIPISHVETDEPYGLIITEDKDPIIVTEKRKDFDNEIDENLIKYKTDPIDEKEHLEDSLTINNRNNNNSKKPVHIQTKLDDYIPPTPYQELTQHHNKPSPPPTDPNLFKDSIIKEQEQQEQQRYHTINHKLDLSFLPPKPKSEPDLNLQEKILKYHQMKNQGISVNENLRKSIPFKNPSILEKLIEFCDIKEFGTNFKVTEFNPYRFKPNEFYEELDKQQRDMDDKRELDRRNNRNPSQIEFTSPNLSNIMTQKSITATTTTTTTTATSNKPQQPNNNSNTKKKKSAQANKYKYKQQPISSSNTKTQPQKGAVITASATINKKRDEPSSESQIESVFKRFKTNI